MSASLAGATRTPCVITLRDPLPASAGQVTMAMVSTALQVCLLECCHFLTSKPYILLTQPGCFDSSPSSVNLQHFFLFCLVRSSQSCYKFILGVCRGSADSLVVFFHLRAGCHRRIANRSFSFAPLFFLPIWGKRSILEMNSLLESIGASWTCFSFFFG